jgi:hypothetical protein
MTPSIAPSVHVGRGWPKTLDAATADAREYLRSLLSWPQDCGFCRLAVDLDQADDHWLQLSGVSRCRHREGRQP